MNLIDKYILLFKKNKKVHFFVFFSTLVFLSAFMIYSFQPGSYLFLGHDIDFHVMRLKALEEALSDGRFPVYIDYESVNGYGYPSKWFYPDILLVPFAFLAKITNLIFAYKSLLFIMSILCGILMYISMKRMFKSFYIAATSSLIYTFSFYRIQDLFERSALGESLSFTFLPIAFLGFYEIIKGNYKRWYILSIGMTLIIFSHVLSVFLTAITLFLLLIFYLRSLLKETIRIKYLFYSVILTIVLSAYFLFPLIEQLNSNLFYYNTHPLFYLKTFTVDPIMILWGMTAGNIYPNQDKNIFLVSMGLTMGMALVLRLFIKSKYIKIKGVDLGVCIGLLYILASAKFFPWDIFPFSKLEIIRFPWRLYEFACYFFSIAGAYYSYILFKTFTSRCLVFSFYFITIVFVLYNEGNTARNKFEEYNPLTIERNSDNVYGQGALEYISSKVPSIKYPEQREKKVKNLHASTQISEYNINKGITQFEINTLNKTDALELPLFYYKGYHADLNGVNLKVSESKNGLLEIPQIKGQGRVKIQYSGTLIQKLSPYISVLSFVILLICLIQNNRKENNEIY